MKTEELLTLKKEEIPQIARTLGIDDISVLVPLLDEKDDALRYPALLLLQQYAEFAGDEFAYWDVYLQKLEDENSYQRSIGAMMIAANAKWADGEAMKETIERYLSLLNDEKPITVRQCIQGLQKIVPHHRQLQERIVQRLVSMDLLSIRETMRRSILTDILQVLLLLKKEYGCDLADGFIACALSGDVLDAKTKKVFLTSLS